MIKSLHANKKSAKPLRLGAQRKSAPWRAVPALKNVFAVGAKHFHQPANARFDFCPATFPVFAVIEKRPPKQIQQHLGSIVATVMRITRACLNAQR
jgi:hypothetical protein